MRLLKEEDPDGCEQRKRRRLKRRVYRNKVSFVSIIFPILIMTYNTGSKLWHIDGYDKLTPYGLTLHGCIDG